MKKVPRKSVSRKAEDEVVQLGLLPGELIAEEGGRGGAAS